jgi:hypothetical protein
VVEPVVTVVGVGAVAFPGPPVIVVYHNNVLPGFAIAVKGFATAPWQSCSGEVMPGIGGLGFIVTFIVAGIEEHPLTDIVRLYVPLMAIVVFARVGFCNVLVNPTGPDHAYVAPAGPPVEVRVNVAAEQTGLLVPSVGVAGGVGSVIVKGPIIFETQPAIETEIFV